MWKACTKIHLRASSVGRDSDSLWVEPSGVRIPVGANFPHPSTPVLGPTQWVQGHSRGQSGQVVVLNTYPQLEPRLKKQSYTFTPPLNLTLVQLSVMNSYTELHKNPINGLVADTLSQTAERSFFLLSKTQTKVLGNKVLRISDLERRK